MTFCKWGPPEGVQTQSWRAHRQRPAWSDLPCISCQKEQVQLYPQEAAQGLLRQEAHGEGSLAWFWFCLWCTDFWDYLKEMAVIWEMNSIKHCSQGNLGLQVSLENYLQQLDTLAIFLGCRFLCESVCIFTCGQVHMCGVHMYVHIEAKRQPQLSSMDFFMMGSYWLITWQFNWAGWPVSPGMPLSLLPQSHTTMPGAFVCGL